MFDINIRQIDQYEYVYTAKNECNQLLTCKFYECEDDNWNMTFFITTKRKKGFQENVSTGKGSIKSLIWAKNCLIDFLEFTKVYPSKFKGKKLWVEGSDSRRKKIYKHYLEPLGFKETKDKIQRLYIKI